MTRILIGSQPPTLFLKLRQNRADAADRAQRKLQEEAMVEIRRQLVEGMGQHGDIVANPAGEPTVLVVHAGTGVDKKKLN